MTDEWQSGPLPPVQIGRVLVIGFDAGDPPEVYRKNTADLRRTEWWMGPVFRAPGDYSPKWRIEPDQEDAGRRAKEILVLAESVHDRKSAYELLNQLVEFIEGGYAK